MRENTYIDKIYFRELMYSFNKNGGSLTELSKAFDDIVSMISSSDNFRNYSNDWMDEMKFIARTSMIKALIQKKYKICNGKSNPFSYYYTIGHNAFVAFIKKEKNTIKRGEDFSHNYYYGNSPINI